jgi:hypothetical protein
MVGRTYGPSSSLVGRPPTNEEATRVMQFMQTRLAIAGREKEEEASQQHELDVLREEAEAMYGADKVKALQTLLAKASQYDAKANGKVDAKFDELASALKQLTPPDQLEALLQLDQPTQLEILKRLQPQTDSKVPIRNHQ